MGSERRIYWILFENTFEAQLLLSKSYVLIYVPGRSTGGQDVYPLTVFPAILPLS